MEIVLSVLIATMPSRQDQYLHLRAELKKQARQILRLQRTLGSQRSVVEIICHRGMDINIGKKRNVLLAAAKGIYIIFLDDDDHISSDYLNKILEACKANTDCIGISGTITTNGRDERQWHISKEYGSWYERNGVYYRTPNHISPVKRELALQAGFPDIAFGEDAEYSRRVLPLLKTEVIIPGNIYHYDYRSDK